MPDKGTRPLAMDAVEGSIVVNAPVGDVYERWLVFEDYPKFITAIKTRAKTGREPFFRVAVVQRKQHEATLEVMLRVPQRRLAWRTLADQRAPHHLAAGVVSFAPLSDKSTCVTMKLTSSFGGAVSHQVRKYLHNFKLLVEAPTRLKPSS